MAYELTHQLLARGRDVGLLALFDATGPHLDRIAPSPRESVGVHLGVHVAGRLRNRRAHVKRRGLSGRRRPGVLRLD